MTNTAMILIVVWAIAGIALGWVHFRLLHTTVERLVAGGGKSAFVGLVVLRVAVTAGILMLALLCGLPSLLAAAGGFLIGRRLLLSRAKAGFGTAP